MSSEVLALIENQLLPAAGEFYKKRAKVMPNKSPIKVPSQNKRCQVAKIPDEHFTKGVDADLILYVTATNEPGQTYLAWATPCLFGDSSINFRPIAGQINYNAAKLKQDVKGFAKQLFTTLHEIMHVLVFK